MTLLCHIREWPKRRQPFCLDLFFKHKYLGCQVAPINRDFSGTAERLRLMVCRLIADYHGREFNHYVTPCSMSASLPRTHCHSLELEIEYRVHNIWGKQRLLSLSGYKRRSIYSLSLNLTKNNKGMTRNQINDTFLFQNRVKVKVVGEVSEKWN